MKKIIPAVLLSSLFILSGCGANDDTITDTVMIESSSSSMQPSMSSEESVTMSSEESDQMSDVMPESRMTLQVLENEEVGEYLADSDGMTLYYFKKDEPNKSNATGEILENWPAFMASDFEVPDGFNRADFGTIMREDNKMEQVTYKDYPLYYFTKDEAKGDVNGEGINDAWYIINAETTFTD